MSPRTEALAHAITDLETASPLFGDAIARLMDNRKGLPGSGFAGGSRGIGGHSAPVERAAVGDCTCLAEPCTCTDLPADPAAATIREADKRVRRIQADALWLLRLTQANAPRHPSAKDHRDLERVNDPDPECLHCRQGADKHEPFRTITDVGGILPAPVPLCRWHTDFTARNERPASPRETELHAEGRTIRLPA